MYRETAARSLIKAISYRSAGTLLTAVIAYLLTRRWQVALAMGGLEALSKIALFYGHERLWSRVRFGKRAVKPAVIWFTGLSGSGKSTLAKRLADELQGLDLKVEHLDGDKLRELFPHTGFTREERENHVRRAGLLAGYLEKHGIIVVASLISPYAESRRFVRGLCRNFIEVHVSTPLEVCEKRDTKGLYARARRGEIRNFTGLDEPYEPPRQAEVTVDASRLGVEESVRRIMRVARRHID